MTADDVLRVAHAYFAPENRTVVVASPKPSEAASSEGADRGEDVPQDSADGGGEGVPSGADPLPEGSPGDLGASRPSRPVHRFDLPNGVHGVLVEDHTLGQAELGVTLRVGAAADPSDRAGLAQLTRRLPSRSSYSLV